MRMVGRARYRVTEQESDTEVKEEVIWEVAPTTGHNARVIIHNDDVTPYDFVVTVLMRIFEFALPRAVAITQKAHVSGQALVGIYPLEEAKYKVGQAHTSARAEGYPLSFTIEQTT